MMLMAWVVRLHLFVLVALCDSSAAQNDANNTNESQYDPNAPNTWVTDEDRQIAEWASQAVEIWCAGGFRGDRAELEENKAEAVDNLFLDLLTDNLTDYNDPVKKERIHTLIKDYVLSDGLVIVFPALLAGMSVLFWICCCCSACCPCWRACKKKRGKNAMCNIIQAIVVVVFFLVLLVLGLGIQSNHGQVVDGIDNVVCSASNLLETTLVGGDGFIGMLPLLNKFFELEQQMKANSPLMNEVGDIIDDTADIEKSVVLVAAEIRLLGAMLEEYSNRNPTYGNNISLDHTCQLCEKLGPDLSRLGKDLDGGVGNALNQARSQVDSQLTYSKRKSLTDSMTSAREPLSEAKKRLNEYLKTIVDPSVVKKDDVEMMQGRLLWPLLVVVLLALLLVCCGCCSTACCVMSKEEDSIVAPRCATCVWCWAFLYIFLVFLFVALVGVVILPANMLCDLLSGLDADVLQTIGEGMGQNLTSDEFHMQKDLIQACWAGGAQSDNLLDLLFTTNNESERVYLREEMVNQGTKPVDDAFDAITEKLDSMNKTMADNPALVALRNLIGSASVSGLMFPSEILTADPGGKWENDPTYGGLMLDTPLKIAAITQTNCSNFTFEDNTFPGVKFFADTLKAYTGAADDGSPTNSCIQKVKCDSLSGDLKIACDSGNAFLDLKSKLIGTAQFKCNLFKNADGTECDPGQMTELPNGAWSNDCLRMHEAGYAFTEQFERTCTLAEFETYITEFDGRLEKSIARLDIATNMTMNKIVEDMKKLVDKYFVNELHEVADGMTCGFMSKTKTEMIDGLCYQTLAGFSSSNLMNAIAATFIILLAIDMHVVFRITIDSVTEKGGSNEQTHGSMEQTI